MNRAHDIQQRIFFIVALGLGLLVFFGIKLPQGVLFVVVAILVAVVGLPHGALDPLVAWKAGLWRDPLGLARFIGAYLLLAALAGLLWVWAPEFSLAAFLAYSVWHFSGDWKDWLPRGWRVCVAATVICGPSLFYPELVVGYFSTLTGKDATALVSVLQWLAIPALAGTISSVARCSHTRPVVAAELAVVAVAALALPPLIFFLLYFCGLHSPRHLIDTVQGMSRTTATATAAGLTLLTIGLGALVFVLSADSPQFDQRLLQITFIGLAVLTVPHMILIEHYAARARDDTDSGKIF